MNNEQGSSLLETVWALFLGLVIAGAAFSAAVRIQVFADFSSAVLERDRSLLLLPLLNSAWLAGGGCSPDGTLLAFPRVDGRSVQALADTDGPDGFPDGDLDEPFETITVSVARESLLLQSGSGSSQPALGSVSRGTFRKPGPRLIEMEFTAIARPRVGGTSSTVDLAVPVALRNARVGLFPR